MLVLRVESSRVILVNVHVQIAHQMDDVTESMEDTLQQLQVDSEHVGTVVGQQTVAALLQTHGECGMTVNKLRNTRTVNELRVKRGLTCA